MSARVSEYSEGIRRAIAEFEPEAKRVRAAMVLMAFCRMNDEQQMELIDQALAISRGRSNVLSFSPTEKGRGH